MPGTSKRPNRTVGRVVRDTAWNEREFGTDKWPAVEALIAEGCRLEDPARLSRVVSYVAHREQGQSVAPLTEQDAVIAGIELRAPRSVIRGAFQALIVDSVLEACRHAPDVVVELGSGWSRNLFSTWLAGGTAKALYVGAELTAAGRQAAERLASLEPTLAFASIPFDLTEPDLGMIAGHERAVVFTTHSVDYVPELSPTLFEQVRSVARSVTCIHFENFGWQVSQARASTEAYARRNDYNSNLYDLLIEERDSGRLELESVSCDVVGFHPGYSASVAVWHAQS